MAKDLQALRSRLKIINKEEKDKKESRKIVFLEEPPVLKQIIWDFSHKKKDSLMIGLDNELSKIFKENMKIYEENSSKPFTQKKIKTLEKLSKKYKINIGELKKIKGKFFETENPEIDLLIKKISKLNI